MSTDPPSPDRERVSVALDAWHAACHAGESNLAGMSRVVTALDAYDREHRAMVLHSAVQAGRADLRERIATDIEARIEAPEQMPCVNGPSCPECHANAALRTAARIARGGA